MAKNALCIGINDYPGTGSDLAGCINDANDWKAALEQRGFRVQSLLNEQATKQAMQQAIKRLVQSAQPGDLLVITYSGHGSWIPDTDQDEPDARDEVLCPYDIAQKRPLTDDELYDIFAERKRGVRIVMISDSCHSGSVTRMPGVRGGTDAPRVRFLPPEHFLSPADLRKAARQATPRVSGAPRPFGGVLLSGCQDTEYSYDATFNRRPNGAFTYFALKALSDIPADASYRDWYQAIRAELPNQSQPQTPNFGGTPSQMEWQVFETERRSVENDTRGVQASAGEYLQRGHTTERVEIAQSNRRFTMATTATTADIEQTVRRILSQVLTEVTDELTTDGEPATEAPDTSTPTNKSVRARSGAPTTTPPSGGPGGGETEAPDDGAGEGEAGALPPAVLTAVQEVSRALTSEQASALAALFEAIGGQAEGGEGGEEEEDPETKEFIELASRKPDEFQAAVDALAGHITENDDGTYTITASRSVTRGIDQESYAAIRNLIERSNEDIQESPPEETRPRFFWPWLIRLIIREVVSQGVKIAWSKVRQGIAAVRRNYRRYPGKPGSRPWLRAAARDFIRATTG